MENGESEERRHSERTRLDMNRSTNEHVRSWMLGVFKMKRKLKDHPQNDIRRFFNGKVNSGDKQRRTNAYDLEMS